MFKVFISANSLRNLCLQEGSKDFEEQSDWYKLLRRQTNIYLDRDISEELKDTNDPLTVFFLENHNPVVANINLTEITQSFPAKMLEEPRGVYFVDSDKKVADQLQTDYGIICHAVNDYGSICPLTNNKQELFTYEGEKETSWNDLFPDGIDTPSNSLVIIDRTLFIDDVESESTWKEGVINIKAILKSVLPNNLKCEYHILILTGECNSRFNNRRIAEELINYVRYDLKKQYDVVFQFISVNENGMNYNKTISRSILSNYSYATVQQSVKAYKSNGEATYDQSLTNCYYYSTGLKSGKIPDSLKSSDLKIKYVNEIVEDYLHCRETSKSSDEYVFFEEDFKNRLIREEKSMSKPEILPNSKYIIPLEKFDNRHIKGRINEDFIGLSDYFYDKSPIIFSNLLNEIAQAGYIDNTPEIIQVLCYRLSGFDKPNSDILEKNKQIKFYYCNKDLDTSKKYKWPVKNLLALINKTTASKSNDNLMNKAQDSKKTETGNRYKVGLGFFEYEDKQDTIPDYQNFSRAEPAFLKILNNY